VAISSPLITTLLNSFAQSEGETFVVKNIAIKRRKRLDVIEADKRMKSELEDFDGDTDADLAAYVKAYRTRIVNMTDEIDAKERGEIDEVTRDTIATLKWERGEERERLEQIKDEQKRRAATSKG
jgi:hypothetical protein